MKTMAIALSLAFGGAVVSGCATGPPVVSKADIEADLAEIVREAGAEPEWVKCRDDLVGEVGQRTRCEVEATPTELLLAPIVTVTSVEAPKVNWEYKPAVTQRQLERQVADMVEQGSGMRRIRCLVNPGWRARRVMSPTATSPPMVRRCDEP
jgi:hypothetical protein